MKNRIKKAIKSSFLFDLLTPILDAAGIKKGISKRQIKRLFGNESLVFLEVGCCEGNDSLEFLKSFKNIKLYCFEPDPRAIEKFKSRIQDSRCELDEIAISDKDGKIILNMSGGQAPNRENSDWNKSSSIKTPAKHLEVCPWCNFDKKISVKTKKLDSWIEGKNIERIDFIWADVQGAEKELINGALKTLNEKTRYFYTEFNNDELYEGQPRLDEILKMLPNFKIVKKYNNNVLLKNTNLK